MRCLFCLRTDPAEGFSVEHVFPDGVGGTLKIYSVCKPCNSKLGHSVDHTVTDHALVQLARLTLHIPGKGGVIPNPLERGVLRDDPQQKVLYKLDPETALPVKLYTVPHVKREQTGPTETTLSVRLDIEDADQLGPIVNKALTRAGAKPLPVEEIERLKTETQRIDQPWMTVNFAIDVNQHRRGVLKIVYELACMWLGDTFVDDPNASMMRQFIFDKDLPFDPGSKYPLRGTMVLAPKDFIFPFWDAERSSLIGAAIASGEGVGVYVRVLGVMEALIQVTDDEKKYPQFQQRFISIDPVTGTTREATFEEEVARICGQ